MAGQQSRALRSHDGSADYAVARRGIEPTVAPPAGAGSRSVLASKVAGLDYAIREGESYADALRRVERDPVVTTPSKPKAADASSGSSVPNQDYFH